MNIYLSLLLTLSFSALAATPEKELKMTCINLINTNTMGVIVRCENKEVVCYMYTSSTSQCKFKD